MNNEALLPLSCPDIIDSCHKLALQLNDRLLHISQTVKDATTLAENSWDDILQGKKLELDDETKKATVGYLKDEISILKELAFHVSHPIDTVTAKWYQKLDERYLKLKRITSPDIANAAGLYRDYASDLSGFIISSAHVVASYELALDGKLQAPHFAWVENEFNPLVGQMKDDLRHLAVLMDSLDKKLKEDRVPGRGQSLAP